MVRCGADECSVAVIPPEAPNRCDVGMVNPDFCFCFKSVYKGTLCSVVLEAGFLSGESVEHVRAESGGGFSGFFAVFVSPDA